MEYVYGWRSVDVPTDDNISSLLLFTTLSTCGTHGTNVRNEHFFRVKSVDYSGTKCGISKLDSGDTSEY